MTLDAPVYIPLLRVNPSGKIARSIATGGTQMPVFGQARHASILGLAMGGAIVPSRSAVRTSARQAGPAPRPTAQPAPRDVFDKYCVTCHNERLHTAGLSLDTLDPANPGANPEVWEKVVAKLRQQ